MALEIQHLAAAHRFETTVDGFVSELEYNLHGSVMTITHTGVPEQVGGRGIAGELVRTALETARREGWKVVPACSYAQVWMERHPAFNDHARMNTTPRERRAMLRHWAPVRFVRARPWLAISGIIFVAVCSALLVGGAKPASALLLGFDAGALLYLSMVARMFHRATAEHMARHAQCQDTGRRTALWVAVTLSVVVMVALSTELHAAKNGGAQAMGMAALSIVLSWLFMNTMYALHYAHGYYGDFGKPHEGLEFPGTKQPDYWDFVYFAFVIGMCFQVSDVQITSHTLRRTALLHSVVAFFFNVFIIAISVNIAAGLA